MEENSDELLVAIAISATAHMGQSYGDSQDYFEGHVCKVVDNIVEMAGSENPTQDEMIVAYLHDVVEDTKLTTTDLLRMGVSVGNVSRVERLTKDSEGGEIDYLERVRADPVACKVKIADALANLTQSVYDGNFRRIKKYTFYIQFLTGAWDDHTPKGVTL